MTTLFLSPPNLEWLLLRIGAETGRLLNREVIVIPNNALFTYVEQLLVGVPNLVDAAATVQVVNEMVYNHEVTEQYRGLRRRELFFKWFFFKDRPRVIEPPLDPQGRHREMPLTSAPYSLGNPFSRFHNDLIAKQRGGNSPTSF